MNLNGDLLDDEPEDDLDEGSFSQLVEALVLWAIVEAEDSPTATGSPAFER